MKKFTLTIQQIQLLKAISNDPYLKNNFYFAWWTALAYYYYQHRISDDIDFFSNQEVDGKYINMFFLKNKNVLWFDSLAMTKMYDRYIFVLNFANWYKLKTEFSYFFPNLYPLHTDKKLWIKYINKKDVIIDKLWAMLDRTTEKDYFDFFWLYNDLYSSLNLRNLQNLAKKVEEKRWIQLSISYFIKMCSIGYKMDYSVILKTKDIDISDIKSFYFELWIKVKDKLNKL